MTGNVELWSFLLLFLVFAVAFGLPIWGILDVAMRPDDQFKAANQSKLTWILVQFFLGIIGWVAYMVAVRPKLKAAAAQR